MASNADVPWEPVDHSYTLYDRVNHLRDRLRREFPPGKRSVGLESAMRDLDIACLELETTALLEAEGAVERFRTPDAMWLKVSSPAFAPCHGLVQ